MSCLFPWQRLHNMPQHRSQKIKALFHAVSFKLFTMFDVIGARRTSFSKFEAPFHGSSGLSHLKLLLQFPTVPEDRVSFRLVAI